MRAYFLILLFPIACFAQRQPSNYGNGLIQQYDAPSARAYLGIYLTNISGLNDFLTNNRTIGTTFSNTVSIDAAHSLFLSNLTASRMVFNSPRGDITNASASGAVPLNADGTSTTFAQVAALGNFLTNNESLATVFSNTLAVDAAHQIIISNATPSRVTMIRADNGLTNATASGAVPINADGTATVFSNDITNNGTVLGLKGIAALSPFEFDQTIVDTQGRTTNGTPRAGLTWLNAANGVAIDTWNAITYGAGRFVIMSITTNFAYSQDGNTWISSNHLDNAAWNDIAYGYDSYQNDLFVAVASSTTSTTNIMYSPNGYNWYAATVPYGNKLTSVCYGNGIFVAVASQGTNEVLTSPDGVNWAFQTAAQSNQWQKVAFANNLFVSVALDGANRVMTSTNGTNWFVQSAAAAVQWRGLCYGNGKWVASSISGLASQGYMTSTDGTNWTARTTPEGANQMQNIAYGDGLFGAVAGANVYDTSPDGITWTSRANGAPGTAIAYGNHQFVSPSGGVPAYSGRPFENKTFDTGRISGLVLTNNWATGNSSVLLSNFVRIDKGHQLYLSNVVAGNMLISGLDSSVVNVGAGPAASPINSDGTATTGPQIKALIDALVPGVNASTFTNRVNSQSANYNFTSTDWLVLLTGAHSATLPTAVGIGGKIYGLKCSSSGTNALLTTSAQTIDGFTKWTNTAVNSLVWVVSDNANWWVIGFK